MGKKTQTKKKNFQKNENEKKKKKEAMIKPLRDIRVKFENTEERHKLANKCKGCILLGSIIIKCLSS
jgi:hypothetical protein